MYSSDEHKQQEGKNHGHEIQYGWEGHKPFFLFFIQLFVFL